MVESTILDVEQEPIRATMIADSVHYDGPSVIGYRISTLHLRYPRFIHAELMTHRVFSRNARSSRAVPTAKLLQEPIFEPVFGQNIPGMQSKELLHPDDQARAIKIWHDLATYTREAVDNLYDVGVHKQWANRPLEWFGFIDVLVTSTDWANWNALRNHPDAMPEIQKLACLIDAVRDLSVPIVRYQYPEIHAWHLPYITDEERGTLDINTLCKISAARCARISYTPFDESKVNVEADLALFDKLGTSIPLHASPFEHQAKPDTWLRSNFGKGQAIEYWLYAAEQGNFCGWRQFRKTIQGENVQDGHYIEG